MSEELIKRSDAIKALGDAHFKNWGNAVMVIQDLPTIEPKRGEWIDDGFAHRCSICGKQGVGIEYFNFCPNCGADMREREGE